MRYKLRIAQPDSESLFEGLGVSQKRFDELGEVLMKEMNLLSKDDKPQEGVQRASETVKNKEELFVLGVMFGLLMKEGQDELQGVGGLVHDPRLHND